MQGIKVGQNEVSGQQRLQGLWLTGVPDKLGAPVEVQRAHQFIQGGNQAYSGHH